MTGLNHLSKKALIEKIRELECQEKDARSKTKDVLYQKIQDNSFLTTLSYQLADAYYKDAINDIALPAISEYTGALFSLFTLYSTEKKTLDLMNVKSGYKLVNSIVDIAGKQILKTSSPVSDSNYERIIQNKVKHSTSITELSFGAIPSNLGKAIKTLSGVHHFFVMAHVNSGKLFATSFLAFKKTQNLPSLELLESYANITAVAIRNKLTEAALKEREANLKAITENTIESIWSIDRNYRLLYFNEVMEKSYYNTFGVRLKRGDNALEILPPELQDIWKERYDYALKNENIFISDSVEGPDGLVYIDVALNPIKIDHRVVGVSIYGKDVTENKVAELELIAAKEKAEESDRLKSAFLANMSHEIRTPMNGILGFAGLLKKPELEGEKQLKYIDIIQKSGNRILNIINDLINISKIEAGQEEIILSETVLNEQLRFVHTFFSSEAELKGLSISLDCPLSDKETSIVCDKEKVYAVLTNLIKNAIKFTHNGSISIGYKLKGDFLEFYVEDTGIGIPKKQQESVFNRFVQVDTELSSKYEGSGLGLAISKAYIQMLGGEMWLVSKENVGSTFFFTIPVIRSEATSMKESMPQDPLVDYKNTKEITILHADDDKNSQLLIQSILSGDNYTVLTAENGEEAVEMCRENPNISIVLMDIKMPVMSGLTAAKYIKKLNPKLPIIAQTAFALESDKNKYASLFDDYLTKPIHESELRKAINDALK